jgi:DNA-binding NarL/FixJ family response regulator
VEYKRRSTMPCRLLLADDHDLVRKNLREIIEFKTDCVIVCEAKDGLQAVALAKEFEPDIALVDISMPGLDGLDAARQIHEESPQTKILILTMHDAGPLITKMRQVGVDGYLLKSEAPKGLALAISSLLRDQPFFHTTGDEQPRPEEA